MSAVRNLLNERFGRLAVIARAGTRRRKAMWLCRCDCKNEKAVAGQQLTRGKTRSCGCLQREEAARKRTKHGATHRGRKWPEWGVWWTMRNRCHRSANVDFERYGGRGIVVCDRWRFGEDGKTGFECFIADMGRRPSPELTVERKDNDGNYEPSNCKWATRSEQARNHRPRKRLSIDKTLKAEGLADGED